MNEYINNATLSKEKEDEKRKKRIPFVQDL